MPRWRSVFVSDLHLGARGAQPARLLAWLAANSCSKLYVVGDLFDGLHAVRQRNLPQILREIAQAPEIVFIPGNHDKVFRLHFGAFGRVTICPHAIHETANGRRYLVTHGDEFDSTARNAVLVAFGARVNEIARHLAASTGARWLDRRLDAASLALNRVGTGGRLGSRLAGLCAVGDLAGVITGHFHAPGVREIAPGITHVDCGDWLRACSAVVETDDGDLRLQFAA